jgi:hypothetical protein
MAKKDYAAIAKASIIKPSNNKRMPRLLVYGRNKKGKTRFSCTAPDVLIVDPESGASEEKKIDPDTWPIEKWEQLNDIYLFLKNEGKSPTTGRPYKWVCLDGMTRISNYALRWVMTQNGDHVLVNKPSQIAPRDYGRAGEMVKGLLHNFHTLRDIGIIFTAQERMEIIEEVDDTLTEDEDATPAGYMFVPDLPKGARSGMNGVVDLIGRIYIVKGEFEVKKILKGGKEVTRTTNMQRRLWVGPDDRYDTGARSAFVMPDFIENPTVASVVAAMREGK